MSCCSIVAAGSQLDEFLVFVGCQPGLATRVDRVTDHPVPQARFADPEITSGLTDRVALSDQTEGTTPELRRVSSRHYTDSFRDDHRLTQGWS